MTTPAWSVIVPTYNRPQQLARCRDALSRLQPPAGGFEVIVVNDGGTPVGEMRQDTTGTATTIRYATQQHEGPAAARNTGASMEIGRAHV